MYRSNHAGGGRGGGGGGRGRGRSGTGRGRNGGGDGGGRGFGPIGPVSSKQIDQIHADPWQHLQAALESRGVLNAAEAQANYSYRRGATAAVNHVIALPPPSPPFSLPMDRDDQHEGLKLEEEGKETPARDLSCGISLVILGKSISVDLTRSIDDIRRNGHQCDYVHIHSTILWRSQGFKQQDLRLFVTFRKQWLHAQGRSAKAEEGGICTFDISQQWGAGSNYIRGELCDFIEAARAELAPQLGCDATCSGRPPHTSLRKH